MFSNASGLMIQGGTFIDQTVSRTSRGIDLLMEWVATGAFHDSDELYDAPKCHPHTRVAVLNDIMQWVGKSEFAQDDFMLWLFGPAGAGKSAIAKKIAEIAAEMNLLIATFFFSRTSPSRNNKDRLIATLAYQMALSIPDTRIHIETAIERDPAIFKKAITTQIDTLLIKPLKFASTQIIPFPKLIIIDGLDECNGSQSQVAILDAISHTFPKHNLSIKFLVVSRPEIDLVTCFTNEPLKTIHRLPLDNTYLPNNDIRLFFSDKFEHIKRTHPLKSTIPICWPTPETLETLVCKSSGHFIYAATVIRFVESTRHQPTDRLNIILGILPSGTMKPFTELDALYNRIFSSVDDIQLTLRVLSLYVVAPRIVGLMSPKLFLSLEQGDIYRALINLSSIVSYDVSSEAVKVLHASLTDFLFDKQRSTIFFIDVTSTCTDYFCRMLQCIKGPDGMRAGDFGFFCYGLEDLRHRCIFKGQLQSDILNFDINAFANATITRHRDRRPTMLNQDFIIPIFIGWRTILAMNSDDRARKEGLDRCNEALNSRIQIYQSNRQLQLLLLIFAVADTLETPSTLLPLHYVPKRSCRRVDFLLGMDDHHLHLVDRDALDLRHGYIWSSLYPRAWPCAHSGLLELVSPYLNGDSCASGALYFMQFLSNPQTFLNSNGNPKLSLTYAEWNDTCGLALYTLCKLLPKANTSPELVHFLSNHDIHPAVRVEKYFIAHHSAIEVHILAFLSRASVCVNWRIVSIIQRAHSIRDQFEASGFEGNDVMIFDEEERLDPCCLDVHSES